MGKVVVATVESRLYLISHEDDSLNDQGNCARVFYSSAQHKNCLWIIDSGETYHMTFDSNDFRESTPPRQNCHANANGVTYPVTGVGTMSLSLFLSLSHTLLVPPFSNKLIYVSQVTTNLNCVVLIYPNFCLI
jgi:hypothetical protein